MAVRAHASPATPGAPLPDLDDSGDAVARDAGGVMFAGGDVLTTLDDASDDGPLGPHVADVLRSAPALPDVIAAALRTAGVDRSSDPVASWRGRSRWSALVPTISTRAGNTSSWRDVDDPTLLTVSHGVAFDVRASWRLDELIYDPNELRFAGFELALRRERRKLASITTRLYYAWLRAASRVVDDDGSRAADSAEPRAVLRAAELASQLDALTAGWFSERRTRQNR